MKNKLIKLIDDITTKTQFLNVLDKSNISYKIDKYIDYLNIKIPTDNGCLRIYKLYRNKHYTVQEMILTKFEYSGIPTFFVTNNYF